jgi:hypothetical protein
MFDDTMYDSKKYPWIFKGKNVRYKDITGARFGKLTVVSRVPVDHCKHKNMWLCHCDCGNIKISLFNHLVRGNVKTCGICNTTSRRGIPVCIGFKSIVLSHYINKNNESIGQISRIYGITKNTLIGYINRAGFCEGKMEFKKMLERIRVPEKIDIPLHGCLYSFGDPGYPGFSFCGDKATHGAWCKKHYDIIYMDETEYKKPVNVGFIRRRL